MNRTIKALALFFCLSAALLLTACHVDTDPWPASNGPQNTAVPTAMQAQPAAPVATAVPGQPSVTCTPEPAAQPTALPESLPDDSNDNGLNG